MFLGLTYAQFVGATGLAIVTRNGTPAETTFVGRHDISVTIGANRKSKSGPGQNGWLTITAKSYDPLPWNIIPVYAVGVSIDGAGFATAGIGKRFNADKLEIVPFWGPALYQRSLSSFDRKDLIQFRTGLDISYPIGDRSKVVGGFYHISNAKITSQSAGIDVFHIGLQMVF